MVIVMVRQKNSPLRYCAHCNEILPDFLAGVYCCKGCQLAFELINKMELSSYYEMRGNTPSNKMNSSDNRTDYSIFDSEAFEKDFDQIGEGNIRTVNFFLNNLTCYACVWVCEQVTKQIDPEAQLLVNMSSGESSLKIPKIGKPLSEYFRTFELLGYGVAPDQSKRGNNRNELARLGVAFFCLMNIMMLAIPEYLDVKSLDVSFRNLFRGISAALAAFSIFYAGWPLLRNAMVSLRLKQLHLDLPISIALIVGFIYSFRSMLLGLPHVYFDSMTAVVALLSTGRFFQARALERIKRENAYLFDSNLEYLRVKFENGFERRPLPAVRKGDLLRILPGEVIPLQSVLVEDQAEISYGLMKGETNFRTIGKNESIDSGAVNGSNPISVVARENGADSFLLQIQQASKNLYLQKGIFITRSEKMARFFIYFTLGCAISVGLYFLPTNPDEAFRRFAAVLLVACPCIFGFGVPLVIARSFQLGIKQGLVFRSQKALEQLCEVDNYYFDKTGTLTEDESEIESLRWNTENLLINALSKSQIIDLCQHLTELSHHHIARALSRWARQLGPHQDHLPPQVSAIEETFGIGLSFLWKNKEVRVGRRQFCLGSSEIGPGSFSFLSIDGQEILKFSLNEAIREDSFELISALKKDMKKIFILSGDGDSKVLEIGRTLGIQPYQSTGSLSPQSKLLKIQADKSSAMVGNGFNDILASSAATIGIAVLNASDALKRSSDLILNRPGVSPLIDAVRLSRECRRVMKRCFLLAFLFNSVAMILALSGIVTPIMAAILMPISSLTVFLSSQRFNLKGDRAWPSFTS